jgi:hypothetical protein
VRETKIELAFFRRCSPTIFGVDKMGSAWDMRYSQLNL